MNHFAYGENCFTFLLFQAIRHAELQMQNAALSCLLSRLKPIIDTKAKPPNANVGGEWHFWLFPNFGKRYGFGEPDALLFIDGHSFWFEVETHVHLRRKIPAFEQSLLQMVRFRLFSNAVSRQWERSRVRGVTLNDKGVPRTASVARAGHPVLGHPSFRKSVAGAFLSDRDHYVLLSKSKPLSITAPETRTIARAALERHQQVVTDWVNAQPEADGDRLQVSGLPVPRFWRLAWEGDLKGPLVRILGVDPVESGGFISR